MAFIPVLPARPSRARSSLAPAHVSPHRRPRMAALGAPVKEDVRTMLNNLLTMTPTTPPETESARVRQKVDPGRKYKVLIFNDESHSKEFVTRVLLKVVPGLTPAAASAIMQKAHTSGKAVVGIWIFEISEGYCDMLRSNGLRSDIEEV